GTGQRQCRMAGTRNPARAVWQDDRDLGRHWVRRPGHAHVATTTGGGRHVTAAGGMWSGSVGSTPGTGSAGSKDGVVAVPLARIAVPAVVFSQPTTTPTTRHAHPRTAHTHLADSSVARKGKREFSFQIFIRFAGDVEGDLCDRAAGEAERRFVAPGNF